MFHRVRDASKIALLGLVERFWRRAKSLSCSITQWLTPHLETVRRDRDSAAANILKLLGAGRSSCPGKF